jgi:hypothetical protein
MYLIDPRQPITKHHYTYTKNWLLVSVLFTENTKLLEKPFEGIRKLYIDGKQFLLANRPEATKKPFEKQQQQTSKIFNLCSIFFVVVVAVYFVLLLLLFPLLFKLVFPSLFAPLLVPCARMERYTLDSISLFSHI